MSKQTMFHPHPRTAPALLALIILGASLLAGCGDIGRTRDGGPIASYEVRRFNAPGQIAQSLDERGRALIFLELNSPEDGTPFDVDPSWTFTISIDGPSGDSVEPETDPVVPRAWRNDEGVRIIGGFQAPTRGNYQVTVSSENCPPNKARMILLPIN